MIQDIYKKKRSLELKWEQQYLDNGKYTLDMVQIDNKIKEVIFEIKIEENRVEHRDLILNPPQQVSVAT
jgi:hypothetical protein